MHCSFRRPHLLLGPLLAATLAGSAVAQGLPDPLPPANPSPIVYCPPERLAAGPPTAQHVLNVFLPRGPTPAAGWPVVIATGYGGGASVPPLSLLRSTGASAPLHALVGAGMAVVHFGVPGLSGNRGLWYPAGHPSGRYESFKPAHDNPEKSAEWAVQWVKVQTSFPFDLARTALRGSSGGAVLAIRTAMGPDRAHATGSAQLRASTRVAAIVALQPPTSIWALEQGPELEIQLPRHLEQAARPFVAATQLDQVDPELQKDYSLMRVAFGTAAARAHNASQALCLVFGDPVLRIGGQVAPFDLDAGGFPVLHDAIRPPFQHDGWFGYVFYKTLRGLSPGAAAFHGANSTFAMRDIHALLAPFAYHTTTYSGTFKGPGATRIAHDWLVSRLVRSNLEVTEPSALRPLPLPFSSGAAPAGRLVVLSGEFRPGATLELGLLPPPGGGAAESIPLLGLALQTHCGSGEHGPTPRALRFLVAARAAAEGEPARFRIQVPAGPSRADPCLHALGLFYDPGAREGERVRLGAAACLRGTER